MLVHDKHSAALGEDVSGNPLRNLSLAHVPAVCTAQFPFDKLLTDGNAPVLVSHLGQPLSSSRGVGRS